MAGGMPRDPETVADAGRDVTALLRALVRRDWKQQTVILNGAEHSGTLRGVTEMLLGIIGESLVRHLIAAAVAEQGTGAWTALNHDLGELLAAPGVRDALDQSIAEMQARIVAGGRPEG